MKRTLVAIGLVGATIAVYLLVYRSARAPSGEDIHEDCAVSECGADGTPLNLYAG